LICFDAREIYVGETDGKNVRQIYQQTSIVPHKHDKGGQSQRRFERGRIEALKHWLKEVAEITEQYHNNRPI